MEIAYMLQIAVGSIHRTVWLLRIDAGLAVHDPGLAEQDAREEFKVESNLSQELLRYGGV